MENVWKVIQEFFALGGWTMWAIGGCSVLGGALFLERLFFLWGEHRFLRKVLEKWEDPRFSPDFLEEEKRHFSRFPRWFENLLGAGFREGQFLSPEALREHLEQFRFGALHSWEKGLGFLGTLARTTPLLGLLGTVLGMIQIFQKLPSSGGGNFDLLAQESGRPSSPPPRGFPWRFPSFLPRRFSSPGWIVWRRIFANFSGFSG